jgi:hypothetical protein
MNLAKMLGDCLDFSVDRLSYIFLNIIAYSIEIRLNMFPVMMFKNLWKSLFTNLLTVVFVCRDLQLLWKLYLWSWCIALYSITSAGFKNNWTFWFFLYFHDSVLYQNHFTGAIPKEIGELRKLELLDLRNNNFSGAIPEEIGRLLSLKHLCVICLSFLLFWWLMLCS